MDIKEQIIIKLQEIVKELTGFDVEVYLSIPKDNSHGDYTTNMAMQAFRKKSEVTQTRVPGGEKEGSIWATPERQFNSPLELAEAIEEKLNHSSLITNHFLDKVEAVKPGFINFYLSKESLVKNSNEILQSPERILGIKKNPKYKKAIVEYSSPNIAKPFTIGHLRSTIIGDAVANLLEAIGYEVYRDNHLGDWGTQFGKQIYAIKTWGSEEKLNKSENPIKDLVALYIKFHEEAEKNPELEEEGRKWFKKLEDGDEEARRLWQKCIDWSFKEFDRIYGELGVKFSENNGKGYGESYFEGKMQPIIEELKEKRLLKEDKGAQLVFFPEDKLPPLMIIKKDGATLYATRDLATDKFRLEHYGNDILVINEVGAEQSLYFRQLHETEYMLGWYRSGQRVHIGHGMFRFKEGKMSTRKGNVIWLDDVIGEAKSRAWKLQKTDTARTNKEFHENNESVVINKKEGAAGKIVKDPTSEFISSEQVGIGALKWNDLKRSSHLDVAFDWDEILTMQGNSGPYVQYTYTRTQSVLAKARTSNFQFSILNFQPNEDEIKILRHIQKFPEIVEEAAITYSPNVITEYLFTLSQMFNNFYQKYRILQDPSQGHSAKSKAESTLSAQPFALSDDEQSFRLALTATVGIVLKQGLNLLGIQAPEKM